MKSPLFWDVTQRRMAVSYRRFGTTYRSNLQDSLTLEDGTDGSRSSLFRDVTQRRMVVSYRRFGTTYRSRLRYKTTNPHRVTPQKSEGLTYMAAQASSHGWIKECFNSTCFLYKLSFYLSATSLVLWCLQWAGRYHCNNPCDVELGKRAVRERERERERELDPSFNYLL